MTLAAWKRCVLASVLAVSVAVLPVAVPLEAQQRDTPPTDTRAADTQDEDFPWGLLGLLGLIGLAGLKRRPVEHRLKEESVSAYNRR